VFEIWDTDPGFTGRLIDRKSGVSAVCTASNIKDLTKKRNFIMKKLGVRPSDMTTDRWEISNLSREEINARMESCEITPRKAANITKTYLAIRNIPFTKVSARTIGFSDLLRCSRIWVRVEGTIRGAFWAELDKIAHDQGFYVEVGSWKDSSPVVTMR